MDNHRRKGAGLLALVLALALGISSTNYPQYSAAHHGDALNLSVPSDLFQHGLTRETRTNVAVETRRQGPTAIGGVDPDHSFDTGAGAY
jgi:hypothetical protein